MKFTLYLIAAAALLLSCNNKPEVKPTVFENLRPMTSEEKKELEHLIAVYDTTGQRPMSPELKEEAEAIKKEMERNP